MKEILGIGYWLLIEYLKSLIEWRIGFYVIKGCVYLGSLKVVKNILDVKIKIWVINFLMILIIYLFKLLRKVMYILNFIVIKIVNM